jgi:hypothetical protein
MDSTAHAGTSFVLDIVDKAIKFVAVLIGGLWTWWNYRKGRTTNKSSNWRSSARYL